MPRAVQRIHHGGAAAVRCDRQESFHRSERMADQLSRRLVLKGAVAAGAMAVASPLLSRAAEGGAYQIGCFTRRWKDEPYTVAFDAIAEAGFKYVGLMTSKVPGNYILT